MSLSRKSGKGAILMVPFGARLFAVQFLLVLREGVLLKAPLLVLREVDLLKAPLWDLREAVVFKAPFLVQQEVFLSLNPTSLERLL